MITNKQGYRYSNLFLACNQIKDFESICDNDMKKKILIIGAGPAGLTAGCELLKQTDQFDVVILEAGQEIGGISRTVCCNGNRMDIGGHRFFSKSPEIMKWWKDLLPVQGVPAYDDLILGRQAETEPGGPDPEKEDLVFLKRNRVSRIYYKKHFFDYPVKMNMTTIKNLGAISTLEAGFSYLHAVIFQRPEKNLEDFYINRFGKKLYNIFFEGYTEKLWGRHPREISPDWGAQRVKGLSVMAVVRDILGKALRKEKRHVETSLIESFYYPKYGPGQLWEEAAERFRRMGGRIVTGCKVDRILMEDMKVTGVSCSSAGREFEEKADVVFSSMPLKDLVRGMEMVPAPIRQIAEGLPYRDFVTVGLLVHKLKLKNETMIRTLGDIIPDCWIYVQNSDVKMGRIQIFNNWSPYMVRCPEDTVWIGLEYFCNENDELWRMDDKEWKNLGLGELIKMGILETGTEILDHHCERVKKAYPAYFDTYKDIAELESWLNEIGNLYCIGRNGQHRYNNMDHSMMTAMEAVRVFLSGETDRSEIWNVNTEREYHEERKGR